MRQEILLQPTYRRTMRYGELSKGPLPPCEAQTIPVPHAAEAGAASRDVASASQKQPAFSYAHGEAGRIALHFVEKACARAAHALKSANRL